MRWTLFTLIGVLNASALAYAQTATGPLTLPDAITRGFETSDRLAELAAREDAARAVIDQRSASTAPQVAIAASYTRTNHVDEFSVPAVAGGLRVIYPDVPNNVRSRIDLQWPIYTGGRLQALTRSATGEADAIGQDRQAARADLKLEITRVYLAVVTARAARDVVRQALERTGGHLVDVRNQLSVGIVPPSDVFSIEAQQARQQMLLIDAENLVETSSAELRRLVGLAPDTELDLAVDLQMMQPLPGLEAAQPRLEVAQPFRAVVDEARTMRPERKALQFRIEAATERTTAASAGRLPVLTAIGGFDFSRPNPKIFPIQEAWNPSWDIGVQIRWSLFDGGRTRAETAEAAAIRRAAEARLRDFDSTIEVEVRQRTTDRRSAESSIEAARAGVRAAAEARRVLAERFSAGVATNTDVLTAQQELLLAELELTRALANAQLAQARLDRAMGR